MPDWVIDIIKIVLPGLVIALVTSIITVKLSLRRFYEEKWWEKKYQVYGQLFEALHHLKKYALEHLDAVEMNQAILEEKKKELEKNWKRFSQEFEQLNDLASFQLSTKAVAILDDYEKKKKDAENSDNLYEWIDADAAATIECLKKLTAEAKNDLKIK